MALIQELAYLQIPLQTIELATSDFSDQNFLGHGGFGKVYKGHLPHPNNEDVAVKRLDKKYGQGQNEFLKEIVALASYRHDNIVSLLGFCDEDGEKVLVYKHEANGSLDKHLDDTDLTWERRLQICLDAARGLKYLHEDVGPGHRVIHRDIKSSNILLDGGWKAKISDFGLCKVGPRKEQFSFLVSDAAGTMGYVDPQYMETGILTKESDVYAFGVVLWEVLCGRLAMITRYEDERTFLPLLVQRHYEDKKLDVIFFPNLRGHMKLLSLEAFSKVAYYCLNKDRRHRPTMGNVVKGLKAAIQHQVALERIKFRLNPKAKSFVPLPIPLIAAPESNGSFYPNVAPVAYMQGNIGMGTSFAPPRPVMYMPQTTSYQYHQPYIKTNTQQYEQRILMEQSRPIRYVPTSPPVYVQIHASSGLKTKKKRKPKKRNEVDASNEEIE